MRRMISAIGLPVVSTAGIAAPQNPPASSALAGFDRYELLPLAMGPPYAGDSCAAIGFKIVEQPIGRVGESR